MSETRAFYKVDGGGRYHRDRQCAYLRRAIAAGREQRFEAEEPGIGIPLYEPYAITACSRCGV